MTSEDAEGSVARSALGRFVTVSFREAPGGLAFALAGEGPGSLRLEPLRPSSPVPAVGERVDCRTTNGQWSSTVLASAGGVVELTAPRWLSRAALRQGRRVSVDEPVAVRAGGAEWAGRLRDVSMKGAAVLVEERSGIRQGDRVELAVATGSIQATVRSVRRHQSRLVVVGVSFDRLEAAALRWVAGAVAGRPVARQAPAGGDGAPAGVPSP